MRSIAAMILATVFIVPSLCQSASPEAIHSLTLKLDGWDVERAWSEAKEGLVREPNHPQLLEMASQIAFYRGDYQEALRLVRSPIEKGEGDDKRKGFALLVEETIGVTKNFKRYESQHFLISLDEKQDGILAGYMVEAMEKTYRLMTKQYGFEPKEKIRIEVFPDAKAFYYASTLSIRDIEVTGAVGLAKFNKLMILSPRALVYGYRWLDAVSHEYMHYLIVKLTANKAPIWFHEGLAKFEETRWRDGPSYLSPLYEALLAHGLANGKLIDFERMEPSLVSLETPEDVQLAYAQAASAIEFIIARAGYQGVKQIMERMTVYSQGGASEPIRDVLGSTFGEFETCWKEFLSKKRLKEMGGIHVHRYKVKEGRADEDRLDMGEIKSMMARNRAHLGDLLKERGRVEAAALEYRRALADAGDSVPIMTRLSTLLIDLGRTQEALEILKRARDLSPDHPTVYTRLGQVHIKLKDFKSARENFEASIQINPFDPEVHQGLATASEMLGDSAAALKEREIVKKMEGLVTRTR